MARLAQVLMPDPGALSAPHIYRAHSYAGAAIAGMFHTNALKTTKSSETGRPRWRWPSARLRCPSYCRPSPPVLHSDRPTHPVRRQNHRRSHRLPDRRRCANKAGRSAEAIPTNGVPIRIRSGRLLLPHPQRCAPSEVYTFVLVNPHSTPAAGGSQNSCLPNANIVVPL